MKPPLAVVASRRQHAEDWMRSLGISSDDYWVVTEAKQLKGTDPSLIFFYDFDFGHSQMDRELVNSLIMKAYEAEDLKEEIRDLKIDLEDEREYSADLLAHLKDYQNKPWYKRLLNR